MSYIELQFELIIDHIERNIKILNVNNKLNNNSELHKDSLGLIENCYKILSDYDNPLDNSQNNDKLQHDSFNQLNQINNQLQNTTLNLNELVTLYKKSNYIINSIISDIKNEKQYYELE
jgi:hypothetical protein